MASAEGSLSIFHDEYLPLAGCSRCTMKPGTSTQYSADSTACQIGHSPVFIGSSCTTTNCSFFICSPPLHRGLGARDQAIGRAVVLGRLGLTIQFCLDLLGQHLA